jgi:ferritin-like metal-binding protein YciE
VRSRHRQHPATGTKLTAAHRGINSNLAGHNSISEKDLRALFLDTLKDIFYAEKLKMAGGALKSWATQLGTNEAAELLDQALAEEKKTLSKIAAATVKAQAA